MELYQKHLKDVYANFNKLAAVHGETTSNSVTFHVFQQLDSTNLTNYQLENVITQVKELDKGPKDYLYWVILGRCSAHLHVKMLDQLLEEAMIMSDNLHYWESIDKNWYSRVLFLIQSFPTRLYHICRNSIKSILQFQNFSNIFAKKNLFPKVSKSDVLLFPRDAFISQASLLSLIRHEYRGNAKRLRQLRDEHACKIGCLTRAIMSEGVSDAASSSGDKNGISAKADLKQVVSQWIQRLSQLQGQKIDNSESLPDILSITLDNLSHPTDEYFEAKAYFRPSAIERNWPKIFVTLLSAWLSTQIITKNRTSIRLWIDYLYSTAVDFYTNWIQKPILGIFDTIRSNRADSQITLLQTKSLESDMESLQRMVIDFVSDTSPAGINLDLVKQEVQQGDLTYVLQAYEHDLKTPIRTAVSGNLVRTLLIQLQKTKVDVEVALSGIDRLLKSQELVFATVGITPSLIFCYVIIRYVKANIFNNDTLSRAERRQRFRQSLRAAERILVRSQKMNSLDDMSYGLLVFQVNLMAIMSMDMGLSKDVAEDLLQDLEDIQSSSYGVQAQLRAVDRIYRLFKNSI
ncbi:Nca2 [Schizosaccharomyces pombe]|uniref:Nuclear control of ATPase protein 2 n=1 Tax=Schizosaccharomyces pombe (strain 972 / ATCC 24843) TaxID=284812 RepID=NCA2_SCHPO|nr:putative protein Nca2 [Schizosaccharomyces pombe]O74963.1 RecName: Full=Nuclear control of ATPase protein 2 [Schizosaccharomyces pombe 972h-]CAA19282.1 mitochondrial protein Nca2 (predicted) [Schizosaccharomyces pombe]|eukprot:NP_596419.1 putative protein Nca2 [Schizosaccharomyces pombe]